MTCTFFGHRDILADLEPTLQRVLIDLIEKRDVTSFYVGNNGNFDSLVRRTLRKLQEEYPHIKYAVIPAYMPGKRYSLDTSDMLCPYVFEKTPPRFAIVKRNKWMLNEADIVVTYVTHNIGGAAQFKEMAEKKGKTVINLADEV